MQMLYFIAPLGLTRELPDVVSFDYWMDKPRTKDINRRADLGRRQRSPVGAGDCPERKQKHRIPMPKTFPGEAPELDSLNVPSGRSHTKTAPGCNAFGNWMDKPRTKGYDRRTDSGRATVHQWAPEIVQKENRNTGYQYLKLFRGKPRSLIH